MLLVNRVTAELIGSFWLVLGGCGSAVLGRRAFSRWHLLPYVVAQVAGAVAGARVLYLIASSKAGFDVYVGERSEAAGAKGPRPRARVPKSPP